MVRVLVTGAGGYLGHRLVKRLIEIGGMEVRALVRPGGDIFRLRDYKHTIFQGDLLNKNSVDEMLRGIDIIFHLAAATSGSHFEMMMNTVVATENLLEALKGNNISKLILVSSFSVYQMTALKTGGVLDESCPIETNLKVRDPYTITKVRQEKLVRQKCEEMGIPFTVIRPGKIYGPGDNPIPPQLGLSVPGICFLYISGGNKIPFVHVSNCADAICLAGMSSGVEGEVFNIVDDDLPTQSQYLRLYEEILGKMPRKIWVPYNIFYISSRLFEVVSIKTKGNIPPIITRYNIENLWKKLYYDNNKAKKILNWTPRISIDEGLRDMLLSHAKN